MTNSYWRLATAFALLAALTFGIPMDAKPAMARGLHWDASWTASPFDMTLLPPTLFAPSPDVVEKQTIREVLTLSRGGAKLRVRFSNDYGSKPLHIGAASIGYGKAGRIARQPLTFSGAASIVAEPGVPVVSDPVALPLPDGATIEVSFYIPDRTPVATVHLLGLQPSTLSGPGNYVMADTLPGAVSFDIIGKHNGEHFPTRAFLSEVDVAGPKPLRTVVAFGDSITDGMASTFGANHRWPDYLSRRIVAAKLNLSVVNQGIGGNQVLARGMGDSWKASMTSASPETWCQASRARMS
jgi:hypothetical protein